MSKNDRITIRLRGRRNTVLPFPKQDNVPLCKDILNGIIADALSRCDQPQSVRPLPTITPAHLEVEQPPKSKTPPPTLPTVTPVPVTQNITINNTITTNHTTTRIAEKDLDEHSDDKQISAFLETFNQNVFGTIALMEKQQIHLSRFLLNCINKKISDYEIAYLNTTIDDCTDQLENAATNPFGPEVFYNVLIIEDYLKYSSTLHMRMPDGTLVPIDKSDRIQQCFEYLLMVREIFQLSVKELFTKNAQHGRQCETAFKDAYLKPIDSIEQFVLATARFYRRNKHQKRYEKMGGQDNLEQVLEAVRKLKDMVRQLVAIYYENERLRARLLTLKKYVAITASVYLDELNQTFDSIFPTFQFDYASHIREGLRSVLAYMTKIRKISKNQRARIGTLNQTILTQKDEIGEWRIKYDKIKGKLEDLNAKMASKETLVNGKIRALKREIEEYKGMQSRIECQDSEIKDKNTEIRQLKAQVAEKSEAHTKMQKLLKEQQETIALLKDEIVKQMEIREKTQRDNPLDFVQNKNKKF